MSDRILASPEEIARHSAALNKAHADLDSFIAKMYSDLAPLADVWQSSASTQFNSDMEQLRGGFNQVLAALESMAQLTNSASASYAETEANITRSFSH